MKLSEVQFFRLRQALDHASEVLRVVKQKPVKRADADDFLNLESAVQHLECVCANANVKLS